MAEKGGEDEVQLGVVGGHGNLGRERKGDADAGSGNGFAEAGMGLQFHHDAVIDKLKLGIFGVDVTCGLGVSFDVVAAVESAEELLLEGTIESFAADFEFDCAAMGQSTGHEQGGGSLDSPGCCHNSILDLAGPRRQCRRDEGHREHTGFLVDVYVSLALERRYGRL